MLPKAEACKKPVARGGGGGGVRGEYCYNSSCPGMNSITRCVIKPIFYKLNPRLA